MSIQKWPISPSNGAGNGNGKLALGRPQSPQQKRLDRWANKARAGLLIGSKQAAFLLGISPRTLERYRKKGWAGPCIRPGYRTWLYDGTYLYLENVARMFGSRFSRRFHIPYHDAHEEIWNLLAYHASIGLLLEDMQAKTQYRSRSKVEKVRFAQTCFFAEDLGNPKSRRCNYLSPAHACHERSEWKLPMSECSKSPRFLSHLQLCSLHRWPTMILI